MRADTLFFLCLFFTLQNLENFLSILVCPVCLFVFILLMLYRSQFLSDRAEIFFLVIGTGTLTKPMDFGENPDSVKVTKVENIHNFNMGQIKKKFISPLKLIQFCTYLVGGSSIWVLTIRPSLIWIGCGLAR